jgi:uncharacterized protein YodC (DUF2158 family)
MKVGDVVQLKSGGPAMTVEVVEQGQAWCSWFSEGKKVEQRGFQLDALQPYKEPSYS